MRSDIQRASQRLVRTFLLALAVIMLGSLLSCQDEPIVESDLNFVSADGYSIYTVVYSEETATEELIAVARGLRDTLERVLGCEVALTDDHVSRGTDFSYEILVGSVNRTAVADVLPSLKEDEYTVRVVGHKILLLGEDNRATAEAVTHFIQDVLGYDGVGAIRENPDLSISQTYHVSELHLPPDTPTLKQDTVIPVSPYLPRELLLVARPERTADAMTLATLQGLAATLSGEQILIDTEEVRALLPQLTAPLPDGYAATLYETDAQGETWTLQSLLTYFAPRLQGYILCDGELSSESATVAISLANQLRAVVLSEENRALADAAGLPCVFDATSATLTWLYESQYFDAINRTVAVEQSVELAPRLIDYAVMTGALFVYYEDDDVYLHAQAFRYLDDGAVVLGENSVIGEYRTVQTLSAVNVCYLPARQACNLSTLSGFARDGVMLGGEDATGQPAVTIAPDTEQHTVLLVMTDGESIEWMLDDFTSSTRWYGSPQRGEQAITWGIPATLGELANPVLRTLAGTQSDKDSFIVQLSGVGYAFPSLWRTDALSGMADALGRAMKSMGVSYLQVTDTDAVNINALAPLAATEAVKGIVYTDYAYQYSDGTIAWLGDVPVVTASYRLQAGLHEGSVEYVAESINAAATDPSQESAYSVVMVHARSGLDENGRLVSEGDPVKAIRALIQGLDENVKVVGADEFFSQIHALLSPNAAAGTGTDGK